jgi:hypothetical protein
MILNFNNKMPSPQKLTKEEIEDVAQALPNFVAATRKVANKMREEVIRKLKLQLQDIKIVKTSKSLDMLKEMIKMQFYNSLVPAGEPVGMRAAEAMSQPTTQTALNAFHSAGSANIAITVDSGIDAMTELYQVSKERKKEMCRIHFKDKTLSFEDVIDMRRKLVGVSIGTLNPHREPRNYDPDEEPWWYNLYFDLDPNGRNKKLPFEKEDGRGEIYLRLKFSKSRLYDFNLTLADIVNRLGREQGIVCVPSPSHLGIIDIFVDKNIVINETNARIAKDKNRGYQVVTELSNTSSLFLNLVLIPSFNDMLISGVEGLTQILPSSTDPVNIISVLKEYEELIDESERIFRIRMNRIKMITEGILQTRISELFILAGFRIVKFNEYYYDVKVPEKYLSSDKTPITILKEIEKEEKSKTKNQKDSPFLSTMYYLYAVSNGTNLKRLLSHPLVDAKTTISSNPHEVLHTLGIEAARNFMIKSYDDIILANREYVNGRHIALLADYQTSRGMLVPFTSKGSALQNTGTLAKASFEEPIPAFVDAAVFGKSEEIKSTSTSIFVGKRMIMGTGCFKARIDREALEEADNVWEMYKQMNPEKFETVNGTEQLKSSNNMTDDDDLLLASAEDQEEGENDDKKIGLVGLDVPLSLMRLDPTPTLVRKETASLKYITPVPPVIVGKQELPDFIKNIIKVSILNEEKRLSKSKPVIKTSIKGVIVPNSISKPGLPYLPKMSVSQLLASKPAEQIKEVNELVIEEEYDI